MKRTIALTGCLLLAGLLPAQQDASPPQQDPGARRAALQKEVDAAVLAWRKEAQKIAAKAREARKAGQPAPAMPMAPDMSPFMAKFEAAATDYAGTDDAIPFLLWIVQNGNGELRSHGEAALNTLGAQHAASPKLADIMPIVDYLPQIYGDEIADRFTAQVREKNHDPDVLGWIALHDDGDTIAKAKLDSKEYAKAKADLLAAAEDVTSSRLRQKIHSTIDLRERLGVGCVAPEIEGVDLDGKAFRLSDYRGKVVFLDFWGDW